MLVNQQHRMHRRHLSKQPIHTGGHRLTRIFRIAFLLSFAGIVVGGFSGLAQAQQLDLAFGVSAISGPGASSADGVNHLPASLTGGAYPGFSGDALFYHNVGVGADIFWRASQANDYLGSGFNYRPVLWNINAVYSPRLARHVRAELVAGIGALSTRFYTGTACNPFSGFCTTYQSSNHFDADFGGGIKLYAHGGFFIRPEARVYVINNNVDFSSNHTVRYGASIGYTFGGSH